MQKVVFRISKRLDSQNLTIRLHQRDISFLQEIQSYLDCGKVRESDKDMGDQIVSNKIDLYDKIFLILEKYPLLTRKFYQYEYWKDILIYILQTKSKEAIKNISNFINNSEIKLKSYHLDRFNQWLN